MGKSLFQRLKKWQPLKTVKKVVDAVVPGGKAITGAVEDILQQTKRRRESGQTPADAIAGSLGVEYTTPQTRAIGTGTWLLIGAGVVLLIMLARRR